MPNLSPMKSLLAAAAGIGALVTIWGGISLARPLLESDPAPLSSLDRVAALKSETVKTFGAIQSQSRTEGQATASSFCSLFTKLAAKAEAERAKRPSSADAIEDAESYGAQRDLWCRKMMGR